MQSMFAGPHILDLSTNDTTGKTQKAMIQAIFKEGENHVLTQGLLSSILSFEFQESLAANSHPDRYVAVEEFNIYREDLKKSPWVLR